MDQTRADTALCRYTGEAWKPHPLTVTLLLHLQLILPAYGGLIAVSSYARDTWAVISFMGTLWLIGIIMQVRREWGCACVGARWLTGVVRALQRFFWTFWYSSAGRDDSLVNQTSLVACFVALLILLILLFVAYRYPDGLYHTGSVWIFCVFAVYLVLMMALLVGDRMQAGYMDEASSSFYYSVYQQGMLVMTIALNVVFTVTALVDTTRNTV